MIIEFVLGSARLTFDKKYIPKIMNTVSKLDIRYKWLDAQSDAVCLRILLTDVKKLMGALGENISENISIQRYGLPMILNRYRKRWGIAAGALIFAAMIPISQSVVWTVDISGNHDISDKYIVDMLKQEGFGVGTRISKVDFDSLHNRFLIDSEGIGWISVNMNGTHANVEVRETVPGEINQSDGRIYNLVAAEDGQIERIAAIEGKPQVAIFDTVKAGELLVSGVISRDEGGIRLEGAQGSVYAKVNRSFEVKVPLKSEQKCMTGHKTVKKTLRFFAFDINLFINSGIPYDFYDTIVSEKQIYLFDSIPLPLWMTSASHEEYENKVCTLTEEEAKNEAMALYSQKLQESISDCEMLGKQTDIICTEEEVTVKCELYCLADIAKAVELTVEKAEETDG